MYTYTAYNNTHVPDTHVSDVMIVAGAGDALGAAKQYWTHNN